jgi:UDP-N-acetylglucosamine--N-acetylmuramyl-(pentapeptide) pyrophosphoryl-undecaprenol N-acetylglucosamine transferase
MLAGAKPLIAIACGGTGGHLFPGLAVAGEFGRRGGAVLLLISPKEVDQQSVRAARGMRVETLPAVALQRGHRFEFVKGFWKSYRQAKALFRRPAPQAVLAMGGFTCAPPVLAGKGAGAATFLHEGNTVPGKANRWLSLLVDLAFVNFPSTANRLHTQHVLTTGMPVRAQFEAADPAACRLALGLDPRRPVLLVMGGSQGASAINQLALAALPRLAQTAPELQFLHLAGPNDAVQVQAAYAAGAHKAMVRPFLTEMELALGAATIAITRAGASSLAELAALRVPSILIPYPFAADDHQFYNAQTLARTGAACLLEQSEATGVQLARLVLQLLRDPRARGVMAAELGRWHAPHAAEEIAEQVIRLLRPRNLWPADESNHLPQKGPSNPGTGVWPSPATATSISTPDAKYSHRSQPPRAAAGDDHTPGAFTPAPIPALAALSTLNPPPSAVLLRGTGQLSTH